MVARYLSLPEAFYALAQTSGVVLLESSKPDPREHTSLLFYHPLEVLTLEDDDPAQFFAKAESLQRQGYYLAGYLAYELGYAFVGIADRPPLPYPLAWLGVYQAPLRFDHLSGKVTGQAHQPLAGQSRLQIGRFGLSKSAYLEALAQVQRYLEAGDVYQINFTSAYELVLEGDALALYRRLKSAQPVSYGAYLHTGDLRVVSLSPELFFRLEGGTLTARPMKGTMHRGRTLAEDQALAKQLADDEKSRAENLMIVDLLRNDLGRICEIGSVRVPELFKVERYQSLLQMTSTVQGRLRPNVSLYELFRSLFPCGSVTGAPKKRAMEIIRELETAPRGVYTGAIGYLAPTGDAVFNVAIRTLVFRGQRGTLGVGSGVVIDSDPEAEYRECRLKARFLTLSAEPFDLLETMRWQGQYRFLQQHLARLAASAEYFGYPFDQEALLQELKRQARSFTHGMVYRVRVLLSPDGTVTVDASPFQDPPHKTLYVSLASSPTDSRDPFLYHKTTRRAHYEAAFQEAQRRGLADLLFYNERGELTEGAISNVFVALGGELLTPPLSCGVLPGIYRQHLLKTHPRAKERVLRVEDLKQAEAIYLCNALRGLRQVELC